MAPRAALIKTKKKVSRAAPNVRRGKKLTGPNFTGWETWSGEKFYAFKNSAKYFYYENYQEADLVPEVWRWMKENNYSDSDIKNAKAARGWNSVNVWSAIACKLLHTGCPDFNQNEADYWEALPGTGANLQPMSESLKSKIALAIAAGAKEVVEAPKEEPKVIRTNIQEIMRERASDAFGEIEGIADEFMLADYPKEFPTRERVLAFLNEQKVLPQHVGRYVKHWETIKNEYEQAKLGKDLDLKEGYQKFTKTQINSMIKFASQILDDLAAYSAIKQAVRARATRVRKPVPVEKIVSKLKYMKSFKDEALKIDLTSISPTKLHGCTEAWVYDTKKRKLHHYIADDYSKTLGVKSNMLLGFDKKESGMKTLRKPAEQLKQIMGSKPAARKYFKDIKAVAAIPNGRFNADMIILKAW